MHCSSVTTSHRQRRTPQWLLKSATHEIHPSAQPDGDLFNIESMVNRKICTFGGGYPIMINGKMIGGLGISGGTVAQDMDIASHALQSLLIQ